MERHAAELRRFVARSAPPADVDDLCQEAFLRAHRAYGRLDGQAGAQPRAWLYRIAANVCADHFRRMKRRPAVELTEAPSPAPGPDEAAVANETAARVRTLVAALPRRQRQALVLRRLRGLDYAAIAREMGGNEAGARANVYQAIRRLRRALDEGGTEEELRP